MSKHFSLIAFISVIVGGGIAVFSFADVLLITLAPNSTYAQSESSVRVVQEDYNQDFEEYVSQILSTQVAKPEIKIKRVVTQTHSETEVGFEEIENNPCPEGTHEEDRDLEPLTREHSIPESYVPSDMVPIEGDWNTYCIKRKVKNALENMMADAAEEGLLIQIYSAHRSHAKQSRLYSNWQSRNPGHVEYPAVAEPGHSEHHLGTTVDLKSGNIPFGTSNPFGQSQEYAWMVENAHKYGFTQSYKDGKQSVTGYIAEPWHWRHVGKSIATELKNKGLTISEYLTN